jgi:hypothetical protein
MELPKGEYLTVKDMAKILHKKPSAVKMLLFNAGQRPISKDALYTVEAFNAIKDAPPRGRPKNSRLSFDAEPAAPPKMEQKT